MLIRSTVKADAKRKPHYEDHPGPGLRKAIAAVRAGKVKQYASAAEVMAEVRALTAESRRKRCEFMTSPENW